MTKRRRVYTRGEGEDPWDDPRARQWFARAQHQLLPKIDSSAFVISVNPDEPDAKIAVELGFAILLDKPIVIYAPPGREVSAHLRRVADYIVEGDLHDPETQRKMNEVLDRLGVGKKDGEDSPDV